MDQVHFSAIVINVGNIDVAEAWYRDVLGFVTHEKKPPAFLEMKKDNLSFYLETPDEGNDERRQHIGTWRGLSFSVKDIHAFFAECKDKSITIVSEPKQRPWGDTDGKIADPFGNILIIDQLDGCVG